MTQAVFDVRLARRLAGYEVSLLTLARALPPEQLEGSRVLTRCTPIYDPNGDILFYRYPMIKGRGKVAYTDIAASPAFSAPLLGVSFGFEWDEQSLIDQAISAAKKIHAEFAFSSVRFVAYSYPKVAIQFLSDGQEVVMLELGSWQPVPPKVERRSDQPPSNFERWSLLDSIPAEHKDENSRLLLERARQWEQILTQKEGRPVLPSARINPQLLEVAIPPITRPMMSYNRELHYRQVGGHFPCYEVQGQRTAVWCVAASTQMILDFYRYSYTQERIAAELGLGTIAHPNGLPYGQEPRVVSALEKLTSNALDANLNMSPGWEEFVDEISHNRPLISFIPGHARTVAGITQTIWVPASGPPQWRIRGLLVYDPWPPNQGVITRWENYDAIPNHYRCTFSAHVKLSLPVTGFGEELPEPAVAAVART